MLTVFSKSDVLRTKVPFNTSEVITLYIDVALGGQWVTPPKRFSTSSNFYALRDVSQTKYY